MNCKCAWLVLLLMAVLGAAWGSSCPTGFNAEKNQCVQVRPVHGTCPPGSNYQLNINKCVHA
ncbi:uncharacterized protein LOC6563320 [Drosophila grimshawi]|uniref:GH18176 n=1 Tax=Drosophila grimshawi TaxID=7222 RepID=B4JG54_DROGR|nr:uncharacterized protein LOC6563320 [Drosophila grimshawi]EDV93621.1 GH18176 [Drosophila grimshawi]